VVDHKPEIETLSKFAKFLEQYEAFPENIYYSNDVFHGNFELKVINRGKYLKAQFYSILACDDNTGIYQRWENLNRE